MGYSLGVWSCPRLEPEASARAVSALYVKLSLSFCIFETEWEYKTDGGGIDVARVLSEWRKTRPRAYTGFAVEGNAPDTFNHAAVQADGYSFLCPENYWGINGSYDVRACLERCVELDWELWRVKPTLTGVGNRGGDSLDAGNRHTIGEALLRYMRVAIDEPDVLGALVWRGDMMDTEDYRILGLADTISLR